MPSIGIQTAWLFLLAIPVATVSWTFTHEEILREPREYCKHCSETASTILIRKFFYLFTCEYCFSHYIAIFFIWLADYQLLMPGWRGYLIAWFALVWIANFYMSIMGRLRTELKTEKIEAKLKEEELKEAKPGVEKETPA